MNPQLGSAKTRTTGGRSLGCFSSSRAPCIFSTPATVAADTPAGRFAIGLDQPSSSRSPFQLAANF